MRELSYEEATDDQLRTLLKDAEAHGYRVAGELQVRFDRRHAVNFLNSQFPDGVPDPPPEKATRREGWTTDPVYVCGHPYMKATAFCATCFIEFDVKYRQVMTLQEWVDIPNDQPRVFMCGHPFISPPMFVSDNVIFVGDDRDPFCRRCHEDGIETSADENFTPLEYLQEKEIRRQREKA